MVRWPFPGLRPHGQLEARAGSTGAGTGPAVVVIGLRAGFRSRSGSIPRPVPFLQENLLDVGPLTGDDLGEAAEGPAAAAGLNHQPRGLADFLATAAAAAGRGPAGPATAPRSGPGSGTVETPGPRPGALYRGAGPALVRRWVSRVGPETLSGPETDFYGAGAIAEHRQARAARGRGRLCGARCRNKG
jgi:hypothetical protein